MDSLNQHISTLQLPEMIKNNLLNIHTQCLILFANKINEKAPSDILINELNNTFLHTYFGPFIH